MKHKREAWTAIWTEAETQRPGTDGFVYWAPTLYHVLC